MLSSPPSVGSFDNGAKSGASDAGSPAPTQPVYLPLRGSRLGGEMKVRHAKERNVSSQDKNAESGFTSLAELQIRNQVLESQVKQLFLI